MQQKHSARLTIKNIEKVSKSLCIAGGFAYINGEEIRAIMHFHNYYPSLGSTIDASTRYEDGEGGGYFSIERDDVSKKHRYGGKTLMMLKSRAYRTINDDLANSLFKKYGDNVFDEIIRNPALVAKEFRLPGWKIGRISRENTAAPENFQVIEGISRTGLGHFASGDLVETYGKRASFLVRKNIFSIIGHNGMGFKNISRIALESINNADKKDIASSAAGALLLGVASKGHTAIYFDHFIRMIMESSSLTRSHITAAIKEMVLDGDAIMTKDEMNNATISPSDLFNAEKSGSIAIRDILSQGRIDLDIPPSVDLGLASGEQIDAIKSALCNHLSIITGGPGTGKTTTIKGLINSIKGINKEERIVLAAPTGKASKRMSEVTGIKASTIHRLLGIKKGSDFDDELIPKIEADTIIIDEFSMVDAKLFSALVRSIPRGARLVVVGDYDQLHSVDPGNVLYDMINSNRIPKTKLSVPRRVEKGGVDSRIISAAHDVNSGRLPDLKVEENSDFHWIDASEDSKIADIVSRLMFRAIPNRLNISPHNIQIISPQKSGLAGVNNLNKIAQDMINPPDNRPVINRFGQEFRINDRVMQTKNDKELGVNNGETGVIIDIDPQGKFASIDFDGEVKRVEFNDFAYLNISYASTIHKSQGSEFDAVIIPISKSHIKMLDPQVIYTAITRAKKHVFLVGDVDAFKSALSKKKERRRQTSLCQLLKELLPALQPPAPPQKRVKRERVMGIAP